MKKGERKELIKMIPRDAVPEDLGGTCREKERDREKWREAKRNEEKGREWLYLKRWGEDVQIKGERPEE